MDKSSLCFVVSLINDIECNRGSLQGSEHRVDDKFYVTGGVLPMHPCNPWSFLDKVQECYIATQEAAW